MITSKKIKDLKPKFIGLVTLGVKELFDLDPTLGEEVSKQFNLEALKKEDWFYEFKVKKHRFFACDNGEIGYTVMLPSEY